MQPNKTKQSQDLEQYWRTGKKPANAAYTSADSDDFGSGDDNTGSDQPLPADDPSVNYMGPDQGPFECANCVYFIGDGQPCQKVSDPVESEGYCNLFESAGNETQQQEHSEGSDMPAPAGDQTSFM